MVRSRILALSLASLCSMQMAQANTIEEAGKGLSRVIIGSTVGAAGFAAVNMTYNMVRNFVMWSNESVTNIDAQMTRLCALAGGTTGLMTTTYARVLRAQWNLWFLTSKELVAITMADYQNDTQLVDALQHYYLASTYPLVAAKRELANKLNCLNRAARLVEAALEDISEDSERAQDLNAWLEEIYIMRAYVAHAADVIERDPRLYALLDAQNKVDTANALQDNANAMWLDALGHIAVAATRK